MGEIVGSFNTMFEEIIFWFKISAYFFFSICIVWLFGFLRRNLGLDPHSIELRRIRRLLEGNKNNVVLDQKVSKEPNNDRTN